MLAPTLSRVPTLSAIPDPPAPPARRRRRPLLTATAGGLVALLLASCTPPDTSSTTGAPSAAPDPDAVIEPAWEVMADIVGGAAATEDGIVAYEIRDGEFVVSAWSLDGERLWSEPADPGWMTSNDELRVRVDERDGVWNVTHLSTADTGMATRGVIVREVATGQLTASAPGVIALDPPYRCEEDTLDLCVVGWDSERRYESARLMRFEAGAYSWEIDDEQTHPEDTLRLSSSIFLRGTGAEHSVGAFDAGQVVWEQPLAALLGEHRGISSWGTSDAEDSTLLWIAQPFEDDGTRQLADQAVLAVDSSTGEPRWIERGAGLCGALREPVQTDPVVLCRFDAGTEELGADGRRSTGVVMSMAAVDIATGGELWSLQVDGHPSHIIWTQERHSAREGFAVVHIDGALHQLDLRTGSTEIVDDDTVFACDRELGSVDLTGSNENLDYDRGLSHFPCDSTGEPSAAWTVASVQSAGARADDATVVVRTADGLAGFEIPAARPDDSEQEDDDSTA